MPIETFQNYSNFTNDVTANTLYVTSKILSGNTNVIQVISSVVNNSDTTTTLNSNSASWIGGNSAFTTLNSNSASWVNTTTTLNSNSASWVDTTTTLNSNSASWIGGNSAFTTLNSNSASWIGGNSAFTTLNSNSASWVDTTTTLNSNSASWIGGNSAFTTLNLNSATYVYLANIGSPIGAGATTSVGLGTFSLVANGVYEVIYDLWYLKTTTGTVVYLLSGVNNYANVNGRALQTAIAGPSAFTAPTLVHINNKSLAVTPFPVTGSLTNGNTHSSSIIYNIINSNNLNTIQIAVSCAGAGTITPLAGSQGKITRIA